MATQRITEQRTTKVKMTKAEARKTLKILQKEKAEIKTRIESLSSENGKPNRCSCTTHPADDDSEIVGLINERQMRRAREKLTDINTAIERMESERYGICERCGGFISQNRLRAKPEARFCVKCKNGFELENLENHH